MKILLWGQFITGLCLLLGLMAHRMDQWEQKKQRHTLKTEIEVLETKLKQAQTAHLVLKTELKQVQTPLPAPPNSVLPK